MGEKVKSDADWQKAKDEVLSWMDNELRCVTAQRISQSLDMTRKQGSLLLEEILKERSSKSQITYCRRQVQKDETNNTTVFRLQSSTSASLENTCDDDDGDGDNCTVFALASLQATEMISTAHERDMVQWREMIENKKYKQLTSDGTTIVPADKLDTAEEATATKETTVGDDDAMDLDSDNNNNDDENNKASSSPSAPTMQKPFANKPAKAVTAAAFFAKRKTATSKNGTNATQDKAKTESSKTTTTSSSPSSNKDTETTKPTKPSSSQSTNGKGKTTANTSEKKKNDPKVGNADDFVADEEESDDDIPVVTKKSRRAVPPPKEPTPPPSPQSPGVRGAMDAFCEEQPKSQKDSQPKHNDTLERRRKRRKKMVEKTTMVNGYIRTEVQAVWEDVPTDEEEEEKRSQQQQQQHKKKTVVTKKNPQQMKQKSLMGFFKKK